MAKISVVCEIFLFMFLQTRKVCTYTEIIMLRDVLLLFHIKIYVTLI